MKVVNDKIHILTGNDSKLIDVYVEELCRRLDKKRVYCESIVEALKGTNLFNKPSCFVLRDDKEMTEESKLEKVRALLHDNELVLIYTTIDKRLKFYKQYKDYIIELNHLDNNKLVNYLRTYTDMKDSNIVKLCELCENDLGRALLEIDKIERLGKDSNDAFDLLLKEGIIYQPPRDAVFDLVDAILQRNPKRSYQYLQECKDIGEANLVIMSNLFTNAKHVLQVQSYSGNDIQKATGLSAWQVRKAEEKANYYSNQELINIMRLVQRVEESIKTGKIEDEISVDYILGEIFNG